ncbi:MAG: hypothetical protein SFX72_08965 [Isosphaeraceae bacterium]|nr:hypothetical protein [Isosphaeraceae bacterium]
MPRLRKTTTSSRTWLLLATGLIGVAPATAIAWMRLANDDAPAATAAAPGSIDTSSPPPIELPPALPEPEAARPSIDSPVVSTGVALEPTPPAAPPPPLPAPAQEAAPKPSPKPTGGFVDGPILARPIDEPIPAASGRSAAGTSDPPPPPTPALPRGTSEPPTQAPGDTPALLPLERGGPGFAPPVPTPLDRPATDAAPGEEERGKRIAIAGKGPITIRLVEESIRKALDLLAQQAGVNILPSTQVAGTVTLNLENVTFEEALDALTRVGNLGVRREGTLIYVYTSQELKTLDAERKTPVVRVYCLNYVRANDLAAMIRPFLSQEGSISVTPANQSGIGSGTAAGTVAASRDAGPPRSAAVAEEAKAPE